MLSSRKIFCVLSEFARLYVIIPNMKIQIESVTKYSSITIITIKSIHIYKKFSILFEVWLLKIC